MKQSEIALPKQQPKALDSDWQFPDPPNALAFLSEAVSSGSEKITFVSHDIDDGAWQFLGDSMTSSGKAVLCCLSHPINEDPTLIELSDLPLGWCAERTKIGAPWKRYNKLIAEEKRYAKTWHYIQSCERILSTVFFVGWLWMAWNLLYVITENNGHLDDTHNGLFPMLIMFSCVFLAALVRPLCPRCNKLFFKRGLTRGWESKDKCIHCGLPRNAKHNPDD